MAHTELEQLEQAMTIGMETAMSPLQQRVKTLEARVRELETRGTKQQSSYAGIWRSGVSYPEGVFCTDRGALWACLRPTGARPGQSADWQLAPEVWEHTP